MFDENKVQYQIIKLPSKGLSYPKDSILSSGQVKLKYPTAYQQNILLSQKLLANGTAIDTFISALCLDKFDLNQLLIGDKNALIYASRILAYGPEYKVNLKCPHCGKALQYTFNLNQLNHKEINFQLLNQNNIYEFILPTSKKKVKFKLINGKISEQIQRKNKLFEKTGAKVVNSMTNRLSQQIIQIGDSNQPNQIRKDVQSIRSIDSLKLRSYINSITPDIDTTISYDCTNCGNESSIDLQINQNFFWPTDVV